MRTLPHIAWNRKVFRLGPRGFWGGGIGNAALHEGEAPKVHVANKKLHHLRFLVRKREKANVDEKTSPRRLAKVTNGFALISEALPCCDK